MIEPSKEPDPRTQSDFSDRPSPTPKRAPGNFNDQARGASRVVYLLDTVVVRDLASSIHVKPFKLVAELMELKLFKSPDDSVDFDTASLIARKHGYRAEKPPPGVLVL